MAIHSATVPTFVNWPLPWGGGIKMRFWSTVGSWECKGIIKYLLAGNWSESLSRLQSLLISPNPGRNTKIAPSWLPLINEFISFQDWRQFHCTFRQTFLNSSNTKSMSNCSLSILKSWFSTSLKCPNRSASNRSSKVERSRPAVLICSLQLPNKWLNIFGKLPMFVGIALDHPNRSGFPHLIACDLQNIL